MAELQPAGWYPDPEQPQTHRFWDGTRWTEQRAPMAVATRNNRASDGLVVAGYLLALLPFLGWFMAFIIGIILLAKDRVGHGLGVIALTILSPVIWLGVLLA